MSRCGTPRTYKLKTPRKRSYHWPRSAPSPPQLAQREDYQPGDLLTNSDVKEVLKALAAAGWQPPDQKDILAHTLPDDDTLVRTLSTERGKRFMRKVAEDDLIFDRLDRVSRTYGGERMVNDLAKLPDGYKYAKTKRPNGVPGFLDLLPKTGSGKKRSIKDYDKPTGRIYCEKQLLERLENSYDAAAALPAT